MKKLLLLILCAGLCRAQQSVTVLNNGSGTGTFNTPGVTDYVWGAKTVDFTGSTVIGLTGGGGGGVSQLIAGTNITLSPTNGLGTVTINSSGGSGSPGGSNTQVQYNNSSSFGGSSNFTFNNSTGGITVLGASGIGSSPNGNSEFTIGGNVTVAGNTYGQLIDPTLTSTTNTSTMAGAVVGPVFTGSHTGLSYAGIALNTPTETSFTGSLTDVDQVNVQNGVTATYNQGIQVASQTAGSTGNTDIQFGGTSNVSGNRGLYQSDAYGNFLGGFLSIGTDQSTVYPLNVQASQTGTSIAVDMQSTHTATGNTQSFTEVQTSPTWAKSTFTGLTAINSRVGQPTVSGSGTIATSYQLYLDAGAAATTSYGIYQAGTDLNYFGGALSMGSNGARATTNQNLTPATTALTESSGAETINWASGNNFTLTLNANNTISFSNAVDGQVMTIEITNTASNFTNVWTGGGLTIKWPANTAPVQTVGAHTDVYTIIDSNGTYYGSYVQNF